MKQHVIKYIELFSGIGMQRRGLENANVFMTECVATCEMDGKATESYAAIHNGMDMDMINNYDYPSRQEMADYLTKLNINYDFLKGKAFDWQKKVNGKDMTLNKTWLACQLNKNLGDICKVDTLPNCDLVFWSFPCTDLSVAGRGLGMIEGETRSGLAYEVLRILKNMKKEGRLPAYLIMENVDALLNKKNKQKYELLNEEFSELGYDCVYDLINGKYTGVPQNRNRCYGMYIRKDINKGAFSFPKKFDSGVRIKDILIDDEEVGGKYYLNSPKALDLIDKVKTKESYKDNNVSVEWYFNNLDEMEKTNG